MTSCRQARAAILAVTRQQATEAETLRLEEHLAVCAGCRAEKARWRLLEHLRDEAPQRLSVDARDRVLEHITLRAPVEYEVREPRTRRFLIPSLVVATAAMAIFAMADLHAPRKRQVDSLASRNAGPGPAEVAQERTIRAQTAGTVEASGAHIAYRAGSLIRILANERRVELYAGEVDVEVAPGGPGRFRVFAPRFIVEVVGTRFVVRPSGVDIIHGTVRVLDSNGRELAVLRAGGTWRLPEPNELPLALAEDTLFFGLPSGPSSDLHSGPSSDLPSSGPSSVPSSTPIALGAPEAIAAVPLAEGAPAALANLNGSTKRTPKSSVDVLIAEARSYLAAGDPELARERIASALSRRPAGRQRAVSGLLVAASFLMERRYDEALIAYRRTAESSDRYPESETAAFAIAQLLCERVANDEARIALEAYIDRFPEGRFVQDARRKLASLP